MRGEVSVGNRINKPQRCQAPGKTIFRKDPRWLRPKPSFDLALESPIRKVAIPITEIRE